jgi:hypothetical protein
MIRKCFLTVSSILPLVAISGTADAGATTTDKTYSPTDTWAVNKRVPACWVAPRRRSTVSTVMDIQPSAQRLARIGFGRNRHCVHADDLSQATFRGRLQSNEMKSVSI